MAASLVALIFAGLAVTVAAAVVAVAAISKRGGLARNRQLAVERDEALSLLFSVKSELSRQHTKVSELRGYLQDTGVLVGPEHLDYVAGELEAMQNSAGRILSDSSLSERQLETKRY